MALVHWYTISFVVLFDWSDNFLFSAWSNELNKPSHFFLSIVCFVHLLEFSCILFLFVCMTWTFKRVSEVVFELFTLNWITKTYQALSIFLTEMIGLQVCTIKNDFLFNGYKNYINFYFDTSNVATWEKIDCIFLQTQFLPKPLKLLITNIHCLL